MRTYQERLPWICIASELELAEQALTAALQVQNQGSGRDRLFRHRLALADRT
jgi:ribosome-associated toxin RatA of RatAB toxin-antitoxin module